MLTKLINLILKLFNKHHCDWEYSDLKHHRMFYPPDRDIYTRRVCKICDKKQKVILGLNQEGEVFAWDWVDDN